jgi:hypothetical protein
MTKLKLAFISMAIIGGVCGALASRVTDFCEYQTQYYKFNNSYYPAGVYGSDFTCVGAAGICTYYKTDPFDPNSFAPCHQGSFEWIY